MVFHSCLYHRPGSRHPLAASDEFQMHFPILCFFSHFYEKFYKIKEMFVPGQDKDYAGALRFKTGNLSRNWR